MDVLLWGALWWEPSQERSLEKGDSSGLSGLWSFGFTHVEGFVVYLPPEQVKYEFFQPLCLDLF